MKITKTRLAQIIKEEITRITEGEVVDMFPPEKSGVLSIANALAQRAMEMLDLDGDGDDIEVRVEPALFLSPYIDYFYGDENKPLAKQVFDLYVSGKAGDQAHSLEDIIERIGIDYFDEAIDDVMKSLGDDRFDGSQEQMLKTVASAEDGTYVVDGSVATDPEDSRPEQLQTLRAAGVTHVVDNDGDGRTHTLDDWEAKVQMATTQDLAAQQDPSEVEEMGKRFERFLQGIESGDVVELEQEED